MPARQSMTSGSPCVVGARAGARCTSAPSAVGVDPAEEQRGGRVVLERRGAQVQGAGQVLGRDRVVRLDLEREGLLAHPGQGSPGPARGSPALASARGRQTQGPTLPSRHGSAPTGRRPRGTERGSVALPVTTTLPPRGPAPGARGLGGEGGLELEALAVAQHGQGDLVAHRALADVGHQRQRGVDRLAVDGDDGVPACRPAVGGRGAGRDLRRPSRRRAWRCRR